jgi:hypothetical protein
MQSLVVTRQEAAHMTAPRPRQWELDTASEIAPPLLLGPGAAERLTGVRASALRNYASQPGGPVLVRLSSRRLMFDRLDLVRWIARRSEHPPALMEETADMM